MRPSVINIDGIIKYRCFMSRQSVGRCGNKFTLLSKCEVDVIGTWYQNGIEINPAEDTENYIVFSTGELQIRNLTNSTVGYYVCVSTLNNQLGSYQTRSTNIVLSIPSMSIPSMFHKMIFLLLKLSYSIVF